MDGGVEVVIGEVVDDDAVDARGEPVEEADGEVVGERARDDLLLDGDVDGEPFAGADGEMELAVGGIFEKEERYALLLVAELEALLVDADHLELDFVGAGGHGRPLRSACREGTGRAWAFLSGRGRFTSIPC